MTKPPKKRLLPRPQVFVRCVLCGCVEDVGVWLHRDRLQELQTCQECHTWAQRVKDRDDPSSVRICHTLFAIMPDEAVALRRFTVHFFDGRKVTANVWWIAPIPERFQPMLPDNASWGEGP